MKSVKKKIEDKKEQLSRLSEKTIIDIFGSYFDKGFVLLNEQNEIHFIDKTAKRILSPLLFDNQEKLNIPYKLDKKIKIQLKVGLKKVRRVFIKAKKIDYQHSNYIILEVIRSKEKQENDNHKYQSLSNPFNRLDLMTYRFDFQKNEFISYSQGFDKIARPEQNINKNGNKFLSMIIPEDQEQFLNFFEKVKEENLIAHYYKEYFAYRIKTSNGIVWLNDYVTIHSEKGEIVYIEGIASDLSSRIQEYLDFIETDKIYKSIANNSTDGVFIFDLLTNKIDFSDNWFKMLGYDKNELKPLVDNLRTLIHPDDLEYTRKEQNNHIRNKTKSYSTEYRIKQKNGKWKWLLNKASVFSFDETGKPSKIVGINLDISQYKKRIYDLEKISSFFDALIKYSSDSIFIIDQNGKILYLNEYNEKLTGIKNEEFLNKYVWDTQRILMTAKEKELFPYEQHKTSSLENIRKTVQNGVHGPTTRSFTNIKGITFYIETSLYSFYYDEIPYIIGINKDITGSRLLKSEIRNQSDIYDEIFERLNEITYKKDLTSQKYSFISPNFERITNYNINEFSKLTDDELLNLIHPEDRENYLEYHNLTNDQSDINHLKNNRIVEFRLKLSDGSYKYFLDRHTVFYDEKNQPNYILGTLYDLSELRRNRFAEDNDECNFKLIVENQNDLILKLNNRMICKYANPAYCRLFGKTFKEIVNFEFSFEYSDFDVDIVNNAIMKVLKRESEYSYFEVQANTLFGKRWIGWTFTYLESNTAYEILAVGRDITKQRRIEEALKYSEINYRGLFENAYEPIIIFEPENEIIINVNNAACEVYGFTKNELIGKSMLEFSVNPAFGREMIQKTGFEEPFLKFKTIHRNKNGEEFDVEIAGSLIKYGDKKVIMSIHRILNN